MLAAPERRKPAGLDGAFSKLSRGVTPGQLYRKNPPYARSIMQGRRSANRWIGTSANGRNHTAWVLVGSDAWTVAKDWHNRNRLVTLLPPDESAKGFNWACLSGLETVLLHRCGHCEGAVAMELIKQLLIIGLKVLEHPSLILHERGGNE